MRGNLGWAWAEQRIAGTRIAGTTDGPLVAIRASVVGRSTSRTIFASHSTAGRRWVRSFRWTTTTMSTESAIVGLTRYLRRRRDVRLAWRLVSAPTSTWQLDATMALTAGPRFRIPLQSWCRRRPISHWRREDSNFIPTSTRRSCARASARAAGRSGIRRPRVAARGASARCADARSGRSSTQRRPTWAWSSATRSRRNNCSSSARTRICRGTATRSLPGNQAVVIRGSLCIRSRSGGRRYGSDAWFFRVLGRRSRSAHRADGPPHRTMLGCHRSRLGTVGDSPAGDPDALRAPRSRGQRMVSSHQSIFDCGSWAEP